MRGNLFRNLGVGAKIGLGYALVTLVLIGAVLTTIWQVRRTADITNRVVDLRVPTAQASLGMLNGMNHSLAALRGWIILGKDKFKDERGIAWSQEIEPAMATMKEFAVNWTDPKNIERLNVIESKLADFKTFQREIEDIAQTIANTPATKILYEQAAPRAKILAANITRMIDLEAEQEATPERKALLGMMADTRGTLGLGLGAIRAYLLSGNDSFKDQFQTLWTKNTRRFGDLSKQVDLLTPEQREAYDLFAKTRKEFEPLPPKMFAVRGSDEWNLANRWLGTKAAPTAFAVKENLDAMIVSQKQLMATDMAEGKTQTATLMTIEWTLLGAGVILCAILGTIITRSITTPFKQIFKGLKSFSRAELNETADTFNRIIDGMTESVEQVNDAAAQVSNSSQQLAEGSSEQASSLEETSSALEQMAAMTRTNAENAKQANEFAIQSHKAADNGTVTMTEISESSSQISRIIKVIEEIAFQTNLLALNAAVEAARAGEHGKGFAVVAEEVRNLAQRAAGAAKEINSLIKNSVDKSQEGVSAIKTIVEGVAKVTDLLSGISTASEEQAQGVEQVNTAVSQMDKVTQSNAAGAEESASAAEQLTAQAQTVQAMVRDLVTVVGQSSDKGGRGSTRAIAAPKKATEHHAAAHVPAHHAPLHQVARAQADNASYDDAPGEAPTSTSDERQLHDF